MTSKIGRLLRKHLAVCLAAALLVALGAVSYAEYVRSSRTMRTVAAYGELETPFSSNYLLIAQSSTQNARMLHVDQNSDTVSIEVTVHNYPENDQLAYNRKNITYNLEAYLRVSDGNGGLRNATAAEIGDGASVTLSLNGGTSVTLNKNAVTYTYGSSYEPLTLTGGAANTDQLAVTLSGLLSCTSPVFLELVARPTGTSASEYQPLKGMFGVSVRADLHVQTWSGYFNEAAPNPAVYDGYNYTISGSGSGTFRLRWNPAKLRLNQALKLFDLTNDAITYTSGSQTIDDVAYSYIEFHVDSDVSPRYDVQFYPTASLTASDAWANLVSYTFSSD